MNYFVKLLLSAALVVILASILPGIAVSNYFTAVFVALALALLNTFIKPLLILLTLPVTLVTLGLFLFVINAIIVLIAGSLVDGFYVSGFWAALLFSLLFSVFQSFLSDKVKR
ncbi:MAG: phage holin family protein [Flavobacteriales bacterium]|jgi:putative membrane protein|nr:phage holin family protein [Flavobacteriales bacterium]